MFATPHKPNSLAAYEAFLVPALLLFVLGAWLQEQARIGLGAWPLGGVTMLVGLLLSLALLAGKRWVGQGSLWLIAFVLGGLYVAQLAPWLNPYFHPHAVSNRLPQYGVSISGHVLDTGGALPPSPETSGGETGKREYRKVTLQVDQIAGQPSEGRVRIKQLQLAPGAFNPLTSGQALTVSGDLQAGRKAVFTGGYDEATYLKSLGIDAIVRDARIAEPAERNLSHSDRFSLWPVLTWAEHCRHRIAALFASVLPSPQSQILGGMVLGDRAIAVDETTRSQFIQTGLIHLLAASGMNVAVVTGGVLWLGKTCRCPRLVNIVLALLALVLYCLLTGLPPSIVRSGSMLALALGLKALNKAFSPLLLFSVAVAAIAVVQPHVLASLGFQFSCLTTLAIIGLLPSLQPVLGHYTGRFWAGLLLVPLVAQLAIAPLSVSTFNTLSLIALPLNLLALPLTAGLTLLGFVSALCGLFVPWVGTLLGQALAWLCSWPLNGLLLLVRCGSEVSGGLLRLPSPEPWFLAAQSLWLAVAALFASGWLLPQWPLLRRVNVLLLGLMVLTVAPGAFLQTSRLSLVWLPLSSRQGAWVVQPPHATPVVLLAQAPDWKERKTLEDYLSHQAVLKAPVWVAQNWQQNGEQVGEQNGQQSSPPTDSTTLSAHLGTLQLRWPVGHNPEASIRLLSPEACLMLGLGPSPASLYPLPRFKDCHPDTPWHLFPTPRAQKMVLLPSQTPRLIAYPL